jgi:hypothetical protein
MGTKGETTTTKPQKHNNNKTARQQQNKQTKTKMRDHVKLPGLMLISCYLFIEVQ